MIDPGKTVAATYSTFEMAILLVDLPDNGTHERAKIGDIIAIRLHNLHHCGNAEKGMFLWIPVDGLEDDEMSVFADSVEGFEKRRYCVPLDRLKELVPTLEMAKVLDPSIKYQPFTLPDEEDFNRYLAPTAPLPIQGSVFDKAIGTYL